MSHESNYLQQMQASSYLSGPSAEYVDTLYEAYLTDPGSVSDDWRDFFSGLPQVNGGSQDVSHATIREQFRQQARQPQSMAAAPMITDETKKQAHVMQLINAYRTHGHHHAHLDPLKLIERCQIRDLSLQHHQLSPADLQQTFSTESALTHNGASLETIWNALQKTYADTMGIEFMHISNTREVAWLEQRLESVQSHPTFDKAEKMRILERLTAAEGLEKYLGLKYVGQKRFSLEGGDSFIPLMDRLIQGAGKHNIKEMVLGMAHRGRLNVLVNVLGKAPNVLFEEFEGKKDMGERSGDVKYHMGFSSNIHTDHGDLHLTLAFNPSHLEIIGPVVQGSVRARLRRRGNLATKKQVIPILVHGDAAFAGQGVVMEMLNFSQARGYSTGGAVHIIINNQIGFTTSNPIDARSTLYCSDVAKIVQAPILHVNGDDPEAVVFAAQLALDYRMEFGKDVVIDLVCYRRHGHNEADDPSITQPMMYANIKKHITTRAIYAKRLIDEGVLDKAQVDQLASDYRDSLDKGDSVVTTMHEIDDKFATDWSPYLGHDWRTAADTNVKPAQLKKLGERMLAVPDSFNVYPQVQKLWKDRAAMLSGELPMNWGCAEMLAYASLVVEGYPVRLSGQDSGRGTFVHRHAVLHDAKTGDTYVPLTQMDPAQEQFIVIDSVLSEEAVLAFEYGYATAEPNVLVIWEAQFGDFANGAQVVIDQFISSGEQKWDRLCGLVMLLPHGYEGQGPEHSSARLERYMQLCAQNNMQVCVPSTPAQMFHMLRRQVIRKCRLPLIVMTPKSLLRHKLAVSEPKDLTHGGFQLVIPEVDKINATQVRRVILCAGKVYYDLLQQRRQSQQTDVAILRVEQLYPFPEHELKAALAPYKKAKEIVWCQEEPENQGAWFAIQHHLHAVLGKDKHLFYVGRDFSASPAAGSMKLHQQQQQKLVSDALGK